MNVKQFIRILATVTAVLLTASYAVAQGNSGGHGNGGGGGGGGGGHGPSYSIIPFDPPALPATSSRVYAINENGAAVGFVASGGQTYAVHLDTESEQYTILSDGGAGGAVAHGNNDYDQTVGRDSVGNGLLWETPTSDPPASLATLSGDATSEAFDINNDGVIVGLSTPATGYQRAVAWHVVAGEIYGPFVLPPLAGSLYTTVLDVNEAENGVAMATGSSFVAGAGERVVRWAISINNPDGSLTPFAPENLGTLGGNSARGSGINAGGDVCGSSNGQAFIAPDGDSVQALPPNDVYSAGANDINDIGEIVGFIWDLNRNPPHAPSLYGVLWRDGEPFDLNSFLPKHSDWLLREGEAITNGGLIAGRGAFDGVDLGFVLIPD